jgi:hypothetical protein
MRDKKLSRHWAQYQPILLGSPDPELIFTEPLQKLIIILDTIAPENFWFLHSQPMTGRHKIDRVAMMRVFIAKSVLGIPDNKFMRERLLIDYTLRRICGFTDISSIPCEATFSNVLKEFSDNGIVAEIHEDLIHGYVGDVLLEHISRDATAIPVREKAASKPSTKHEKRKKRGRPKKGEELQTPPKRTELQPHMTLDEMLADLPKVCDYGTKKNSKGVKETWRGYKLHLDVDDHGIPISYILTSASTHDSQAAIPLETMTTQRVCSLYSLMDAGYVSSDISDFTRSCGKVPITAPKKPKGEELIPLDPPKAHRFKNRTVVERANARVKDDLAGSDFRFRGFLKVSTHLGVSILVLAAEQIARYLI